jgi:hypothetical protein
VVGRIALNLERDSTKGQRIYKKYTKTILKHRIHNRENKNTKQTLKKYKKDIINTFFITSCPQTPLKYDSLSLFCI